MARKRSGISGGLPKGIVDSVLAEIPEALRPKAEAVLKAFRVHAAPESIPESLSPEAEAVLKAFGVQPDTLSIPSPLDRLLPGGSSPSLTRTKPMQYLLLIYANEAQEAATPEAEMNALLAEYGAFTQSIIASGAFKAGDRLQPAATATTVRVRGGKTLMTDGPFAETREQLGGYYMIEAEDLDGALAIAARIPSARYGSIEVRPAYVYS